MNTDKTTDVVIDTIVDTTQPTTIYLKGEFMGNYNKVECKALRVRVAPCAQYKSAVHVEFIPKGMRSWRSTVQTSQPTLVVLAGHGHLDPPSLYGKRESPGSDSFVVGSRHASHDAGWARDFDAALAEYLKANPKIRTLADFRGHEAY